MASRAMLVACLVMAIAMALAPVDGTGAAQAKEEPEQSRVPSALSQGLQELGVELPRVLAGKAALPPEPPYGLVVLGSNGRVRHCFTRATERGISKETGSVEWTERNGRSVLRGLRSSTRDFTRRLGLELWTGETKLPVIVAADRRVPWLRVTRLLGSLDAAGVREFFLAALPRGGEPGMPILLSLSLPRETEPHGGHGRPRASVSVRVVAAHGAAEDQVLHRLEVGEGPLIPLDEDVLEAAQLFRAHFREFLASSSSGAEDAQQPWRIVNMQTEPAPCAAVRCQEALPIAATLLRSGLDQVNLGLEDPRDCSLPLREPHKSFDAYEELLRNRQARRSKRVRHVLAVDWLKTHQAADGSWPQVAPDGSRNDLAVTSLALLCFSQSGIDEWGVGPWYEAVHLGLTWLRDQQGADGVFRVKGGPTGEDARLGHALATLAVLRAWGLRPDPAHRAGVAAALEALDTPGRAGSEIHAADVVALLARYVALHTSERLGSRAESLPSGTRPVVQVPDPRPAGWEKEASTWEIQHEVLRRMFGHASRKERGQDFILRRLGKALAERTPAWTEDGQGVEVLAWWLTTVALFEQGGLPWKIWNEALREIVSRQDRQHESAKATDLAGSWDPVGENAGRLGRAGTTAAMGLVKGIYYRY